MYFKKLEILGFKSFAEKVILNFEQGITAVVGPNGCGKSNIFDSIRWALGEQSIKSLRGAKMEDVIFNGTEKIQALGFAEVSVTFSNEAKMLPIDFQEVTITRRLYRSGESEYLLNNSPIRLKDINDLLSGTGIGAESYSLVEQGKIDLVLSSKPEDRRMVFDEATGVSRYKSKKKEALRKLDETENNLLRANDIIHEVRRQIASIERQASKARKYKEVFDRLKELEHKSALNQLKQFGAESQGLRESQSQLSEKIKESLLEQNALSGKTIEFQEEIEKLNQEVISLSKDLINNKNFIETKTQHIKINEERILELDERVRLIQEQRFSLLERIKKGEESLNEIKSSFEVISKEYHSKQGFLEERNQKFEEIVALISLAHAKIKEANSKNFELASQITKLNNELMDVSNSSHSLQARKIRLGTELVKTQNERESAQNELQEKKQEVESFRLNLENIKSVVASTQEKVSESNRIIEETGVSLNDLKNKKAGLESQREFLKELTLKYEDMPDPMFGELLVKDVSGIDEKEIQGIIAKTKSLYFDKENKTCRIECEVKLFSLDIRLIEERIIQVQLLIEEKTLLLKQYQDKSEELKKDLHIQEAAFNQAQMALVDREAVLKNLQGNFDKIHEEISLFEFELNDINENLKNLVYKESELRQKIDESKQLGTEQETVIIESQNEIQVNSMVRESLLLEMTQLKTELTSLKAKETDAASTLSIVSKTLISEKETLQRQENEKESYNTKKEELRKEAQNLSVEIESLKEQLQKISAALEEKKVILQEKEGLLRQYQADESKINSKVSEHKEILHKNQMQEQEIAFKISQIKERMQQIYQLQITDEELTIDSQEPLDYNLIAQELESLRKKASSFGTVNLVAIEELDELRARYDFLEQQRKDLDMAKADLNEAIRKINRTTRDMFLETFKVIVKEFKNYFRLLFNGGDAELFLLDEENVLESGIEIVCRPPGKKLQNISLLSGGEKSLSAVALIFAIFKTKPAPFCILDEIDAALDEANVDRFSTMLDEFAKISQFIVITHNKKTISHADVMYGITMEKSGVSKIISVKLNEHHKVTIKDNEKKSDVQILDNVK